MTATGTRRGFEADRDARRFVFLLDEETGILWEVIGVRGMADPANPAEGAAIKLLDVSDDLPADPFEALDRASWIPLAAARILVVVGATRHDGARARAD